MSNIDKRALREAAEKATPGKWRYLKTTPFMDAEISAENHTRVVNLLAGDVTVDNSEFIAAANPSTVLALLDELEAKDQRIAELEAREVLLPPKAPDNLASCLDGYEKWLIATTFRDTWNACLAEVVRVNAAAGKGE